MIRLTALWLVVGFILVYSWKDWYRGLCGLILLMAVIEHPDMPKSILGIPGVNPWNLLMFNVTLAWWHQRRQEGLVFDLPSHVTKWLVVYLLVVLVGFVRIIGDTSILALYYKAGMSYFINEYLINTIKWVVPALLLYDGCRTEERFRLAVVCVLGVYLLLGVQVAKWVGPQYALDADALEHRSLRVLVSGMGYHRVNLSAMLAGASWAVLSTRVLFPLGTRSWITLCALFILYAQMMTGGRAGYGAWVAVGLIMSTLKWRRFLLLLPAAAVLAMWLAPGVVGRALEGFSAESHDSSVRVREMEAQQERELNTDSEVDAYTVTAGRSVAWPFILKGIQKRWAVGYGRQAMLRTGIATYIYDNFGEIFPHPHNAYLEMLLDNGVLGFALIIPFYLMMLYYSIQLFRDRQSLTCTAVGGASTALILALMVSAMGSQSFYPREGWVGMWCMMFLMLRVRKERYRRKQADVAAPQEDTVAASAGRAARVTTWRPAPAIASSKPMAAPIVTTGTAAVPRTTWRPRGTTAAAAATAVASPIDQPAVQPVAAAASPHTSPWPHVGHVAARPTAIARLGWFGPAVVWDPLVWERA